MQFQTSKSVLTFFLVSLGFDLAQCNYFVQAPNNELGIRIISANCRGIIYDKKSIYEAVFEGWRKLNRNRQSEIFTFKSKEGDTLQFDPPYFVNTLSKNPYNIQSDTANYINNEKLEDMVVHTSDGKLVKVITHRATKIGRFISLADGEYSDCVMTPEMILVQDSSIYQGKITGEKV